MIKIRLMWGSLIFSFVSMGCLQTRSEMKETEQRQTLQQQVVSLQKVNAESSVRFGEIDEQLRALTGKVDSLELKTSQRDPNMDSQLKITQATVIEQGQKIVLLQEELSKIGNQLIQISSDLKSLKGEGKFSGGLKKATASHSTSFDLAEDYFEKQDWKKAILNYEKFRDEQSASSKNNFANEPGLATKYSDATFKIGVCFQELGMGDEAKTFFEEVIVKFPKSAEARRAKKRLKSFKK